jgi:hypothetical protein
MINLVIYIYNIYYNKYIYIHIYNPYWSVCIYIYFSNPAGLSYKTSLPMLVGTLGGATCQFGYLRASKHHLKTLLGRAGFCSTQQKKVDVIQGTYYQAPSHVIRTFVSQRNRELSWNQMQLSHRIFYSSCRCNGHLVYINDYLIIWGVLNFITPTWRWFVDQIWFNVCVYWCIYISGWWFQTFFIFP